MFENCYKEFIHVKYLQTNKWELRNFVWRPRMSRYLKDVWTFLTSEWLWLLLPLRWCANASLWLLSATCLFPERPVGVGRSGNLEKIGLKYSWSNIVVKHKTHLRWVWTQKSRGYCKLMFARNTQKQTLAKSSQCQEHRRFLSLVVSGVEFHWIHYS